ncbi:MAG: HEAT repeat domain-containing protein [Chloroflexota bacterium]
MTDKKDILLARLRAAVREQMSERTAEREDAIAKMTALGTQEDDATINTLITYLQQGDNALLRPLAASRLAEIGNETVQNVILSLFSRIEDREVRLLIMQICADIGNEKMTPALISVLDNADEAQDVRQRAAFALGKCGGEGAYEALMRTLDTEGEGGILQQAITALGWLGDDRCVPDMVQIMQAHPDKETQTFAAEALGRLGSSRAYAPLVATLQDTSMKPIVRYYAAYALGLLGDERAIAVLETVANDADEHGWVAQMAGESLVKLA